MPLFARLPYVDHCCCLPLKTGCIIIGIWYLLTGGAVGHHVVFTDDYTNVKMVLFDTDIEWSSQKYMCFEWIGDKDCPQSDFAGIVFKTIILFLDGLLMCASAVLLVGIFLITDLGCSIFLYIFLLSRIFDVFVLLTFLAMGIVSNCKTTGLSRLCCAITIVICVAVGVYVLIVVKSFRSAIRRWNASIVQPKSYCERPAPRGHSHVHI
nr:uncharacterized protein LOC128682960 [Plodia interpunctella]